jgi:GGDEF domain-containing protein
VARLGGDEFGVLLRLQRSADLGHVLARIEDACASVAGPGTGGAPLHLAIGAAARRDEEPLPETLRRADERMREDKRRRHEAAAVPG